MDDNSSLDELIDDINSVWSETDDFSELGLPYLAFVLQQDIADMEGEDWDTEESVEELADIMINTLRMMDTLDRDPEKEIQKRLENHKQKSPQELSEKYRQLFDESK